MAEVNVKRVKSSEIEFKERLVSINRVTKVTKGGQPSRRASTMPKRTSLRFLF